ncbi:MAG: hypothetical protein LBT00_15675 [Spirochaetaceae bacterium]|nr:hypothetical protein [Spirochaetaceae bacterium]
MPHEGGSFYDTCRWREGILVSPTAFRQSCRLVWRDGACPRSACFPARHDKRAFRHCERSAAIQGVMPFLDCFVAPLLAMTSPKAGRSLSPSRLCPALGKLVCPCAGPHIPLSRCR